MTTPEMISLTVDGKPVSVPKGTNLIDAAKAAGVDIPFYCYHKHLSVAGNCRMCQVQVKGRPKLEIGCNATVVEGMEVLTHETSKEVDDAQAATLEFILINHPLDCTVCDQAGHCKLQDYHYEYNARPSRFVEEKEHKVKAIPLGPNVMLDGERCITCTRCIRFCDEITETSELGMLNRGDKSVIAVNQDKVLDNPLSGTVVDLCPVGALTHRPWRFNTRIWFTKQTDSICPGCSTGCNVKVATRDGEVVQVKARMNDAVNKEWLCDEGRYGFMKFLPKDRVTTAQVQGVSSTLDHAVKATKGLMAPGATIVFVGSDLTLEDLSLVKKLVANSLRDVSIVTSYKERTLTKVQAILISPDYAPNFRGVEFAGLVKDSLEDNYRNALDQIRKGEAKNVLIVGDHGILKEDVDPALKIGLRKAFTVSIVADAHHPVIDSSAVVIPGRSILEKSGMLINRNYRLQYSDRVMDFPEGTEPEWRVINSMSEALTGNALVDALTDREATLRLLQDDARPQGVSIQAIKAGGIDIKARI